MRISSHLSHRIPVFSVKEIRSFEEYVVKESNITFSDLMNKAGEAAFCFLQASQPYVKTISIYCGSGNNGGDGFVLARLLHQAHYTVSVHLVGDVDRLPYPANHAAQAAKVAGVHISNDLILPPSCDLIVDALLGIGLKKTVREPLKQLIDELNNSQKPIISLDIPSGLDADTGVVKGTCIRATATITFIARKRGLMTHDGLDAVGALYCDDLGCGTFLSNQKNTCALLSNQTVPGLPKRIRNSHKKTFGHVLIVGGGLGMPGSVCLTCAGAFRVGAGMVSVVTSPAYSAAPLMDYPEAMVYGLDKPDVLEPLLKTATVCVIGPGLVHMPFAQILLKMVIEAGHPMVLDATALRLLNELSPEKGSWILTPHPGEAADLLNSSVDKVQADRYEAVCALQKRWGGTVVLKGAGTLVSTDDGKVYVLGNGNPGMASAGMGDLLSGIIAGLLAQGLSLSQAALLGVWAHAYSADLMAKENGERGLLASDLLPCLQKVINGMI